MKVLYVINGLGTGGAERSLAESIPAMARRGVEIVPAVLFARQEGVQTSVQNMGIRVEHLSNRTLIGRIIALRRLIAREKPQLIHTTIFEADITGRLAAMGSGVPVLSSIVNTSYDDARLDDPRIRAARLKLAQWCDRWSARYLTAHFHAITHAVKDAAIRDLGLDPARVTVVERGRDPARLGCMDAGRRVRARAQLGLPADARVILNVARQEWQKGQIHLLKAFETIAQELPDVHLVIAGRTGNATSELEQARLASSAIDRIHFLGHRDDVPEILAAADIFAFPSIYEGLGGAVIEAMALSLPIIASDVPALAEVLERDRNALLVPAGSPDAFSDALRMLLSDPERRRAFGKRGREIFEQRFTLDTAMTRMAQLYDRVDQA